MNKKAGTVNGRQVRDRSGEVLFMDLRRWDGNVEEIVIDKGKKKKNVPEFCKSVKVLKKDKANLEDVSVEDKDWSLAPSKYIEFIDHDLDIDYEKEMARIQDEMRLLMASEELSQSMLKDAFRGIGYGID